MQRIPTLLKKISELAERGDSNTAIDIDLMMDYTRVVYADLLEWRNRKTFVSSLDIPATNSSNVKAEEVYEREETPFITAPAKIEVKEESAPVIELIVTPPVVERRADIRQSIGINDKYLFMSELFGNSRDKYEYTMDKINTFDSYNEAEKWLNENLKSAQDNDEGNETLELFRGSVNVFFNTQ